MNTPNDVTVAAMNDALDNVPNNAVEANDIIGEIESFEEDAPAVNNDEAIAARVQETIADGVVEVKERYEPIGILNHSVNDKGGWVHAVVIDNKGAPKQINNLTVMEDTSVQVYDPDNGDVLLLLNEGDENITVEGNLPEGTLLEDIVTNEFFEITMRYLRNDDNERYFIIEGHNSIINGMDVNESFRRRKHMANILDGIESPLHDQLANWFERSTVLDIMKIDWQYSYALKRKYQIKTECTIVDGKVDYNTSHLIVWRLIGGKPVAEILQINVNPGTYLAGTKNGSMTIEYEEVIDEHVFKVMHYTQRNDEACKVTTYQQGGTPSGAIPWRTTNGANKTTTAALEYFDLDNENPVATFINSPNYKYVNEGGGIFNFSMINDKFQTKYSETRAMFEDEWETVLLNTKAGSKSVPEDGFSKPMVHIFKHPKKDIKVYVFVNLPDSLFKKEEATDGTST